MSLRSFYKCKHIIVLEEKYDDFLILDFLYSINNMLILIGYILC